MGSPTFRYPGCYAFRMAFQPMSLSRKPVPFDHPDWLFAVSR